MFVQDASCPCGSSRSVRECCVPDVPLITQKSMFNMRIDIDNAKLSLVDAEGNVLGNLNVNPNLLGAMFNFNMRKPDQIDGVIEVAIYGSINKEVLFNKSYVDQEKLGHILENLRDVLHGVRYHQKNFLFRLQLLNVEHSINPNIIATSQNVSVELDDAPLRYELEAFITKLITCLDVFAKVAAILLNKKFTMDKDLWGYIISSKMKGSELHQIYESRDWIKSLKKIRNAIAHDGSWEEYRAFRFAGMNFTQPIVNNLTAGYFVVDVWADLLKMTSELLLCLSS